MLGEVYSDLYDSACRVVIAKLKCHIFLKLIVFGDVEAHHLLVIRFTECNFIREQTFEPLLRIKIEELLGRKENR